MGIGELVGLIIIYAGLLLICFGVYAVLRLDSFYARMVITSKIEVMGFAVVVLGAVVVTGFSPASLKLLVILFFELLTASIGAHSIARSAWKSGYHVKNHFPRGEDA